MRNWRFFNKRDPQEVMEETKRLENLKFDTDEDQFLFAEVRLGIEIAEFWNSEAGRYLRGRCQQLVSDGAAQLLVIDPSDSKKIAEIQIPAKAAQQLVTFVSEAIANGDASELEINNREEVRNAE